MKKRRTKSKINYDLLSPVEVYRLVLTGKLKKFPNRFWTDPDSVEKAVEITRYLIESILHWSPENIKEKVSYKVFYNTGLRGMLNNIYNGSTWQAINAAYPNQFKEWELKFVPQNFWNEETGIRATKWLIEEKLKWTENEIKEKLFQKVFHNNGLMGMLLVLYHDSPWQAVNAAYPNHFKEWELKTVPQKFWNPETGIQATKWLIEEKLKWTVNDIKKKLSKMVFYNNGLSGMIQVLYNDSPWQALNATYPSQFKEWELKNTPINFWNEETGIRATKWLIEEKLKWTDREIKEKLSYRVFIDNRLKGMLHYVYDYCLWKAINAAYPNRFKEWELRYAPRNFWNKETAIRATKWLIEEKLKWTDHEVKENLRFRTFKNHGLSFMLEKVYQSNFYKALNAAYPGRFQETDLKYGNKTTKERFVPQKKKKRLQTSYASNDKN